MGSGSFTTRDWDNFTKTETKTASGAPKARDQIFTQTRTKADFDPRKIKFRESCDSVDNPLSTPIIVALDVTGSMGMIPEDMIKNGLGRLATKIIDDKPVSDPHLMFMAVGDVDYDSAPLQASQFEADIRVAQQLKDLYLEGGGGGNRYESYTLPWYFAAFKTKIDSFDKRGRKGVLFTVGDEMAPPELTRQQIAQVFGDKVQADMSTKELLAKVQERYEVFHLIVQQGDNYRQMPKMVEKSWRDVLGQNAILAPDYKKIPELIVKTLAAYQADAGLTATVQAQSVTAQIAGLKGKTVAPANTSVSASRLSAAKTPKMTLAGVR